MLVQREFDIREDCWSGAKERIESMPDAFVDYLEHRIVEYFLDLDEVPTDTQVNDFIWFGEDTYAEWFGFSDSEQMWKYFEILDSGYSEDEIFVDMSGEIFTADDIIREYGEFLSTDEAEDYDYADWVEWAEDNDYATFETNV